MIIPGLMALPILLSSSSYLQKNHTSDLLVVFLISILFITLGYFYNKNLKEKNEEESKLSKFHIVVGSLFILRLIWLFLGIVFISQKSLSITMSLVVYTIIGIVAYFNGNLSNKKATKKFGAGLLGFVILRLLTVDVWTMPLASRIVVFILIGILFISTAFIIKKDKKNIIANQ
jgi:hypothetical protein